MYGVSRIYYADGSHEDGSSDVAVTKTGIIAINQIVDGFRRTMCGHDFYWKLGEEWCGGDRHGCDMHLMTGGLKSILFGVNVNTHLFKQIMRTAHDDPDFPRVHHA